MNDIADRLHTATEQLCQPGAPFEIETRKNANTELRFYKNAPHTVRELLDTGRNFNDQEFLVYQNERLSFTAFFAKADAFAHFLIAELAIAKGERIAIAMRNYPEWMIAYYAIVSVGAVVVPLNSWGSADELHYGLSDSQAKLVICDQPRHDAIHSANDKLACQTILVRPKAGQDGLFFEDIIRANLGAKMPEVRCNSDDIAQIMYTSGTTGQPKGAVSTHSNICQALFSFEFHGMCSAMANPDAIGKMFSTGFTPCTLLSVPLFHVSGCYAAFLLNLRAGRKIVMMYKWSAEEALTLIAKERVTIFSAVPSMVVDLLRHPKFAHTDTASLFSIGGGGTACPASFSSAIAENLSDAYVGTGYGMTETNAICSSCTGDAFLYKPNSAGTLSPLVEWQTRSPEGEILAKGEVGEIWLKSACNISTYWQKPEATAESFKDGWMATGDIGYIDDENFVFLVDRAKDIIIRGGENIYPAEIENRLSQHPAIADSAIIAVPDERLGETPGAVIRVQHGMNITEIDIKHYLADKLAAFKQPSHVWFVDRELPRNPAGKILKRELLERFID
jgi:acyl-CoA synthetase (AMP-forming)/AMP-acid ligase II